MKPKLEIDVVTLLIIGCVVGFVILLINGTLPPA